MKAKNPLVPITLTVFLDLLGLGIVIPIAAPLLLTPAEGMLPLHMPFSDRSIILGFLLGIFSIAQFAGAPILGALADKHGRKKMLLLSIAGTLLGYVLFAIGIMERNILLCFVSRALDGFTGGNISIAMSAIADVSEEKDRAKNFGLVGMSFGLGFILGPFIGGILADAHLVSWFDFATPYWFASILSVCNILVMLTMFKETLREKKNTPVSLATGFRNFGKAFGDIKLRSIFAVLFLMVFGFNFFTQFFQVFLIQKFRFTATDIAYFFGYIGLWLAVTQGILIRPLTRRIKPSPLVSWSALLCTLAFPLLLIPSHSWWLYLLIPLVAIFNGINTPNLTAIISSQAGPENQGAIMGMRQSVQSVAMAIPPIIAGFITTLDISLPIWAAAFFTLGGWLLFQFIFRKHDEGVSAKAQSQASSA